MGPGGRTRVNVSPSTHRWRASAEPAHTTGMALMEQPTWSDLARAAREKIARDLAHESDCAERLRALVIPAVAQAILVARRDGLCTAAWLFGSFAWGRPGERSDVDLLVEGCRDPDELAAILAAACGREVHVVRRSAADDSLVKRALTDGRPL